MAVHPALEKHALFREPHQLISRVNCPSCWVGFAPSETLFIAEDRRLIGDPVAGPAEQLRFLPTRFDLGGAAFDPEGARCTRTACPRCRIEFPREMIELPSTFISVVGAPGSGKSNLLTAMTWGLRRERSRLGVSIVDTEPKLNARLHRDENLLFGSPDSKEPVRLAKTEIAGDALLYRTVRVKGKEETLPLPLVFSLHQGGHEDPSIVVLYDNAGEHFLPGADAAAQPVTRHLSHSRAIIFIFDPTQNPSFRTATKMPTWEGATIRQDLVLTETFARVRHHRGRHAADNLDVPLVVVISKADAWSKGAGFDLSKEPFLDKGELDAAALMKMDQMLRPILESACPEFMNAVRAASSRTLIVPSSAWGSSELTAGRLGVRPSEIRPQWASVPLLACLPLEVDALANASLWT
ncbi:MAG: hypothetical protein K8R92_09740 [Planctomycetes bacterium]|nr:hypothetical protein [Planctomycetota bacterium]